jgi:hypothetical protein
MKVFGWFFVLVCTFILSPVWTGYVLSLLWMWFVVTAFHVPTISIPVAIGLGIVVRMFAQEMPDQNKKDEDASKAMIRLCCYAFISPLIALIFGAIVHLFV